MRIASPLARKKARIEIIPLIDIMFFLLATFIMVSLSMIQNLGVPVNLPSARSSQSDPERAAATIAVSKDGALFWNKEAASFEDLPARLSALLASDPDPKVFIHGDREAQFGAMVKVLDAVRSAGVKRTAIRAKKPSGD